MTLRNAVDITSVEEGVGIDSGGRKGEGNKRACNVFGHFEE